MFCIPQDVLVVLFAFAPLFFKVCLESRYNTGNWGYSLHW